MSAGFICNKCYQIIPDFLGGITNGKCSDCINRPFKIEDWDKYKCKNYEQPKEVNEWDHDINNLTHLEGINL